MTDYMKETERLLDDVVRAATMTDCHGVQADIVYCESRAALLAHIQREAVPEGNERDEWEAAVFTLMGHAASLYFLGQSDMPNWFYELAEKLARRHVDEALADRVREVGVQQRAMLADAPAPDHFRDAAKMVAVPADDHIASAIHYPECWDTAAYPTVESALSEVFAHYRCTEHDAPAEVPMPEEDGWFCWAGSERGHSPFFSGYEPFAHSERERAFTQTKMRTYGIACRAAGEAAGYARGLKEADKLLQALRDIADPIAAYERDLPPGYTLDGAACVRMADNPETYRRMAREAIADLREEVK